MTTSNSQGNQDNFSYNPLNLDTNGFSGSESEYQTGSNTQEILFIAPDVPDYLNLIDGADPNIEIITLDLTQDGIFQISQVLAQRQGLDAVHIVTHGSDDSLQLGSATLSSGTLSNYSSDIAGWGDALTGDADILFYGCNLAAASEGVALVQGISNITGADVAASSDLTGSANLGGDWDFEVNTGSIEADVAFEGNTLTTYNSVFATLSGLLSGSDNNFTEDVTVDGNLTLDGDVTLNIAGDFTLDDGFTISGDGTGDRDSLTISASDTVTIKGDIGGSGFKNLTIQAPVIEIFGTSEISTRDANGDSGNITFESSVDLSYIPSVVIPTNDIISLILPNPSINIKTGAQLLADVVNGNNAAGNISITGEDKQLRLGLSPWGYSDKSVNITVDGATLKGGNVTLAANTEDFNPASEAPAWAQKALIDPAVTTASYLISSFTIPISGQWRGSQSGVTVKGATDIDATGTVDISTTAIVDSSVKAISLAKRDSPTSKFAAAYGRAVGDAQTTIEGTTTIDAGGSVKIKSDVTTTAKVIAQVLGNVNMSFGESANGEDKGFSVALANTVTTSKATVDENVVINASGNVNVNANGAVTSEGKAQTSIFLDGKMGVGLGGNWDDTDVLATVNGSITAGGASVETNIDLANVSESADTFTITDHGFETGDEIVYNNGGGTNISIDGLTSGDTYKVFVVDKDTIKLTKDTPLDIDNSDVNSGVKHSLSAQNAIDFDPSTVTNDTITTTSAHGFTTGQRVVYASDANGDEIDELISGTEYYVIVTGTNTFQLAYTIDAAAQGIFVDFAEDGDGNISGTGTEHQLTYNERVSKSTSFDPTGTGAVTTADTGTNSNTIKIDNHGFATGQIVNYSAGAGGTEIGGLNDGQGYFVIRIDEDYFQLAQTYDDADSGNFIDLTTVGAGTSHSFTYMEGSFTFDPSSDSTVVDSDKNTITYSSAHGFVTGQTVFYETDATVVGTEDLPINVSFEPTSEVIPDDDTITIEFHGLETGDEVTYEIGYLGETSTAIGIAGGDTLKTDGTTYYIIKIDDNTIKLAETLDDANNYSNTNNTAIDLTSTGTGTLHNLKATRQVTVGDTELTGLVNQEYYHVVVIDDTTIQLTESLLEALNAEPIDIDPTVATGSNHTFKRPEDVAGISVTATLDAKDKAISKGSTGSSPKYRDLFSNPALLGTASSAISQPGIAKDLLKGKQELGSKFGKMDSNNSFSFGLGVAVNFFDHQVLATVGSTAVLKSDTDVTVSAEASQKIQTFVEAGTSKDKQATAVATALGLGFFTNTVKADVLGGAQIDAKQKVSVTSNLTYPFLLDFKKEFDFSGDPLNAVGNLALLTRDVLFDGKLGFPKRILNTFVTTKNKGSRDFKEILDGDGNGTGKFQAQQIKGGSFGFAFAGDFSSYTNTSTATIGDGAKINQDLSYRTDTQSVFVNATTDMVLLNAVGTIHIDLALDQLARAQYKNDPTESFNIFGNRAKNGIGISFFTQLMNNNTKATIGAGAIIHTGTLGEGLEVKAREDIFSLDIIQAGGDAEFFGFTGSGLGLIQDSITVAQIESGAQVTGGSVNVNAVSDNDRFAIVGSVQQTDSLGFGATVGINDIDRTTKAIIGKDEDESGQTLGSSDINVTGNIDVTAENLGNLWTFSLAGTNGADPQPGADQQEFGVNASGNVAINGDVADTDPVGDKALAYINDNGKITATTSSQSGTGNVTIKANNQTFIGAFSGGYAIGGGLQKSTNFGLFGSYSENRLKHQTKAFIINAEVEAVDVTLEATENAIIVSGAVGLAGTKITNSEGGFSGNLAGSVSLNFIENTVEAYIKDATVDATGNLKLKANDTSKIYAIGGAFGVGLAAAAGSSQTAAVGFSVGVNEIDNTIKAYIDNSTINSKIGTTSTGNVEVIADTTAEIVSVTIGGSFAGTKSEGSSIAVAGAGSGSNNKVNNTITAYIANNSDVTVKNSNALSISATDNSTVNTFSGGASFALAGGQSSSGAISVGASASVNEVNNSIKAYVDNSRIFSTGTVSVKAESTANIWSLSLAGAVSGTSTTSGLSGAFAGAGTGSSNTVQNTIEATIQNGSNVSSTGAISVTATDNSTIKAYAGALSIAIALGSNTSGAVGVGASIAVNNIDNSIKANIDGVGTTVTSTTAGVTVSATSTSTIEAVTVAAGISGSSGSTAIALAGVGTSSDNEINNTIDASITGGAVVAGDGAISLTATDTSEITSVAVAASVAASLSTGTSVSLALGIALATNTINNDVKAYIDNGKASSNSDNLTIAATSNATITATSVAASVAVAIGSDTAIALSGGGADAKNYILTDTNAYIKDSTIDNVGDVTITANSTSTIDATVVGLSGGAAAIGAAVAKNFIGFQADETKSPTQVRAYIQDSSITARGALSATATATESITTGVGAGAVGIALKSSTSVSAAGAGALAENKIANQVQAYIDGDGANGITANSITLKAEDTATITAEVGAAALGVSFAGSTAVSLTIGVSLARNQIENDVQAYIDNADNGVTANSGEIKLEAIESATIEKANAVAASLAIAVSSDVAVALAGAGAEGTNIINNTVKAYIANSTVETKGSSKNITVDAQNTISIKSLVGAIAAAGSGGVSPVSGSLGVGLARNLIGYDSISDTTGGGNQVHAYINNSTVTSTGDVKVNATSTETIEEAIAFAGSVAIAVGAGVGVAGAGVGVTNKIGSQVYAYLNDTGITTAQNVEVKATSDSYIKKAEAVGVAVSGSGVGALSVSGSEVTNDISNDIQAYISSTSATKNINASGNITVGADATRARVENVAAVGVAVSGAGTISLSGAGIGIYNTIDNNVAASVTRPVVLTTTTGDVNVLANEDAYLESDGVSTSIAAAPASGAIGISVLANRINSSIQAWVSGTAGTTAITSANTIIDANSTAKIAKTLTAAISASATFSIGASRSDANISTIVNAYTEGVTLTSTGDIEVTATGDNFARTSANGGALAIVGGAIAAMESDTNIGKDQTFDGFNASSDNIIIDTGNNTITLENHGLRTGQKVTYSNGGGSNSDIGGLKDGDVYYIIREDEDTIKLATSLANAESGTNINLTATGSGENHKLSIDELQAVIGDNTVITKAGALRIEAISTDDLLSESVAASGGIVGIAGTQSDVSTDYVTLAGIGDNARISNVTTLYMQSNHQQDIDASADSFTLAFAAGTGGGVLNTINSKANVDIGTGSTVTAKNIVVNAVNTVTKNKLGDTPNLIAASVAVGNVTALVSETNIGTEAVINIGSGTTLTVDSTNADPGIFQIEALNDITAIDKVRLETVSGFAVATGISRIKSDTTSGVNLDGATLENTAGDIYVTAKTDAANRPSANLLVLTGFGGVVAGEATAETTANNNIGLNNATIKGSGIYIQAGQNSFGVPDLLESSADIQLTAASLGRNISIPVPSAKVQENNTINILGSSEIKALEDITLRAKEGLGDNNQVEDDTTTGTASRATADGLVLNLSLIPYGFDVADVAVTEDKSNNQINIGDNAKLEAGINNQSLVHIKPLRRIDGNGNTIETFLDVSKLGTALTTAEKTALGLDAAVNYEYAALDLTNITFTISTGTVIKDGSNYYEYLPITDGGDSIILETEDYTNTSRWKNLGTNPDLTDLTVYESDVTTNFRTQLTDKFYVIKPVELASPTISYANIGNVLIEQRDKLLDWIANHNLDKEAVARYQVQLEAIDKTLKDFKLLETDTVDGTTIEVVQKELDLLFLNLPDVYASPGSIYIEVDGVDASTYSSLVTGNQLVARAGAEIEILNQSPFTMTVNDVVVRDNRRVDIVNGVYTVFQPGNVYANNTLLTDTSVDVIQNTTLVNNDGTVYRYIGADTKLVLSEIDYSINTDWESTSIDANTFVEGTNNFIVNGKNIFITQDAFAASDYDLQSLNIPTIDQDIFIVGDVVNEDGDLKVINLEGSINVSGEIRAKNVDIEAGTNFNLNTDDWYHSNQDPRQYIDYDLLRAQAITASISGNQVTFNNASDVNSTNVPGLQGTLQAAIDTNESRVLAQGAITVTARYLNVNGLIQSGVDTIGITIADTFNPGNSTRTFVDDNGNVLAGISFTDDVPVDGYFDAAQQAIVVEDIVAQGGSITLAGQIISTGNGELKVASGYANVNITNNSNYQLITNRIDNTTNREGKIQITDTATGVRKEYVLDGTSIEERTFDAPQADGTYSDTPDSTDTSNGKYQPETGRVYIWTEGQEKTEVEVKKYEDTSFNLFGGGTSFEDGIVADNNFKWRTVEFRDEVPLLESESIVPNDETTVPSYASGKAYTVAYEQLIDITVDLIQNISLVRDISDNKVYRYIAASNDLDLAKADFTDTATWEDTGNTNTSSTFSDADNQFDNKTKVNLIKDTSQVRDVFTNNVYRYKGTTGDVVLDDADFTDSNTWEFLNENNASDFQDPGSNKYDNKSVNLTIDVERWTTGGGWLREKTKHTKATITRGLKDFYTHTLKADNPIDITFTTGDATPEVNITSTGDVYKQGNIESPDVGKIVYNVSGSIESADTVADFGEVTSITVGGDYKANIQGGTGQPLNITAAGDIELTVVSEDNQSSSIIIDQIVSTGGGTIIINAPDGITALDSDSLISGGKIELYAANAGIGSATQSIEIDSTDGVAAEADGDIYILETSGDLKLDQPTLASNSNQASITSTSGNVYLETTDGSILDTFTENFSVTNELATNGIDSRVQELLDAGEFGDSSTTDANALDYPVSGSLYSFLYPNGEFLGTDQGSNSDETANVSGNNVTLIAGGSGQLGRIGEPTSINLASGFSALTTAEKELLSTATPADVVGVTYEIYIYQGTDATGQDLTTEDFSDTSLWQKLAIAFTTATDRTTAQVVNVANGQTVLVEYSAQEYGLYTYQGTTGSIDLTQQDYEGSLWQKVTANYATDTATSVDLANGQLVENKSVVERLTLQLADDIDLEATGNVVINAGSGVIAQTSTTLQIDQVTAGGDIRLDAGSSITDANTGTAAITSTGDLTLTSGAAIGSDATNLRVDLTSSGELRAQATGDINIQQVATGSDLNVARVVSGTGSANLDVTDGDMVVGKVMTANDVTLSASGNILDGFDDANAATVINVDSATGNVSLTSTGGNIGSSTNFLDVEIPTGNLSATAGNDIYLNSITALNVDQVTATSGTVIINATGSIVDANNDDTSNINAVNVNLTSATGEVGNDSNPFEINSLAIIDSSTPGDVSVLANGTVNLVETDGDIRIDSIQSTTADVTVVTNNGNIIDANADTNANITGININLTANSGSIGEESNDVEIDSSNPTTGKLNASATSIYASEVAGELNIGSVDATGDVRLTVLDSTATGEDLLMDGSATVTGNNVTLRAGDDVNIATDGVVEAQQTLTIHGDYGDSDDQGTTIEISGILRATEAFIKGDDDADIITLQLQELVGTTTVQGGNSNDQITVNQLPSLDKDKRGEDDRDTLTLDGEAGSDTYVVNITGGDTDYIINVFDTGTTGTDALTVYGTNVADNFLLRASQDRVNGVAFVAALHGDPTVDVERVNYNLNLENLILETQGGNDTVTVDDNWAVTNIRGGEGNDIFQVGQIFKSQRDAAAGVAPGDEFETVQTSRGYLSNGVSFTTTIDGNQGNDEFTVYRNVAVLNMNGNEDDDTFTIRSFALEGSTDSNVKAGEGTNTIDYVANAPVNIDGGSGTDTVRVIGTEFADTFVITSTGVFGAGREINFTNIERLDVVGAEGDDTFYVLSTGADIVVGVYGGLGSDSFSIGGDTPLVDGGIDENGNPLTFNATEGSHDLSTIQGELIIDGFYPEEDFDTISLGEPVMLPGETNQLISTGNVVSYSGTGTGSIIDTMVVETADLLAATGVANASELASALFATTLEISQGNGLRRFWQIRGAVSDTNTGLTTLELENPSQPSPLWTLPDANSEYALVNASATFFVDEDNQLDTVTFFNDGTTDGRQGTLTNSTLSDLGMGATVTYGSNFEVVELLLGSGDDTLNIDNTADGTITTVHGGGGNDTITALNRGGVDNRGIDASLVIFGDTSEDGSRYTDTADAVNPGFARSFNNPGNDNIDASALQEIVNIYGGGGDDTIQGGQAGDHLAGGAGNDSILGGDGVDHIYGDSGLNVDLTTRNLTIPTTETAGNDTIDGGNQDDIILGDHGIITQANGTQRILTTGNVVRVETSEFSNGGNDSIQGGAGVDSILGGNGNDDIQGNADNDIILGDNGFVDYVVNDGDAIDVDVISTTNPTVGGADTIAGGSGNDIILAGTDGDQVDAGENNDLVFGDHGKVEGDVNADLLPLNTATPSFTFTSIDTQTPDGGGDDQIAGNAGDDIVIAGTGNDTVTGDAGDDDIIGGHNVADGNDGNDALDGGAGVDVIAGDNASILRPDTTVSPRFQVLSGSTIYDADGNALVTNDAQSNPSGAVERSIQLFNHSDNPVANTSGDDSIAGGAGDDNIFGQLGDDVIQGDGSITVDIAATGASVEDFAGVGEDGDDYIEGNGGSDTIFGNLGQDDIIGGSSNLFSLTSVNLRPDGEDTIFGGAGTDVERNNLGDESADGHARDADYILGDNGNIYHLLDANGQPLTFNYDFYSTNLKVMPRAIELLDYTLGGDASDIGSADVIHGESGDDAIHGMTGNDVIFGEGQDDDIYGGTGSDRIYGGAGEDGIIGDDGIILTSRNGLTEPLYGVDTANSSANSETEISIPGKFVGAWVYITGRLHKSVNLLAWEAGSNDIIYGGLGDDFIHGGAGDDAISGAEATSAFYNSDPQTNTDPLQYDPTTRKLAAFDANDPWSKIDGFLLNFDAVDAAGNKIDDGKDRIFGDLGNDWLVGGTLNDRIFGGLGDDVINADDNLETNGGANDEPDAPEFADADFVFGGSGLDVMIANTGADRLFDWNGEFNSYFVPFRQFGAPTVNRNSSPAIRQFLLDLGKASGADQSLTEPNGELGLTTSGQTGSPRDPQPGTTNGKRDTQGSPEDDRDTGLPLN